MTVSHLKNEINRLVNEYDLKDKVIVEIKEVEHNGHSSTS